MAEFAGTETNGEAISGVVMSQNKNSVYFDEQQGASLSLSLKFLSFSVL